MVVALWKLKKGAAPSLGSQSNQLQRALSPDCLRLVPAVGTSLFAAGRHISSLPTDMVLSGVLLAVVYSLGLVRCQNSNWLLMVWTSSTLNLFGLLFLSLFSESKTLLAVCQLAVSSSVKASKSIL